MPVTRTRDVPVARNIERQPGPYASKRLKPGSKQLKYHENAERYRDKKIDIRGEYGNSRPPVRVRLSQEETGRGRPPPLQLHDLRLVRILGKGAFGSVGIVKTMKREPKHACDMTGSQLALKIFKKKTLRREAPEVELGKKDGPTEDMINLERRNLASMNWAPFVSGLFACLQDSKNLYMLTELGHCGNLAGLIKDHGPLPTANCQFYFGNLVAAIEYIHGIGLIHCDIKPDNILVGSDGYLMLCDFGIASFADEDRNWNEVGTTPYTPPECLREQMITETVMGIDWWASACVLYEMACGRMTFPYLKGKLYGGNTPERYDELMRRVMEAKYWWPRGVVVDENIKDLCNKMLRKDPAERLGCIVVAPEDGSMLRNDEIRSHPFMLNFTWHAMYDRRLVAPMVPSHIPDLSEGWHRRPLPMQKDVPGIPRIRPAPHLQWDDRFMTRKKKLRQERMQERARQKREQWLGAPNSKIRRIAAWNAEVNGKMQAEEMIDSNDQDEHVLQRAKARIMQMNAAASAQADSPPSSPSFVPAPLDSNPQPAVDADKQPRTPMKIVFEIPGRAVRTPRERTPPPVDPSKPIPIFRPVINAPRDQQRADSPQSPPAQDARAEQLEDSPHKFRLPMIIPKPKPQFKEPMLPEKVLFQEFSKLSVSAGSKTSRESSSKNVAAPPNVTMERA